MVIDGDEAYPQHGEDLFHIIAKDDIVPRKPGQVFDDDCLLSRMGQQKICKHFPRGFEVHFFQCLQGFSKFFLADRENRL